jgi:SAM-dependent methyltransferase
MKQGYLVEREGLRPLPALLNQLDRAQGTLGLDKSTIRVLDWGCGSGVAVEALLAEGWDVYGADIDRDAISAGNKLISGTRLVQLDGSGRSPFPEGHFDFVYSQAVLEHVADLLTVTQEIRRITRYGGLGLHLLPAPFRPIEPHVFMPLVHWLPKNKLRQYLVWVYCAFNIGLTSEINQRAVAGMNLRQKVAFENEYLNNETFYRQFWQLGASFRRQGFSVSYPVLEHPKLERLSRLLSIAPIGTIAKVPILTFASIHPKTRLLGPEDASSGPSTPAPPAPPAP